MLKKSLLAVIFLATMAVAEAGPGMTCIFVGKNEIPQIVNFKEINSPRSYIQLSGKIQGTSYFIVADVPVSNGPAHFPRLSLFQSTDQGTRLLDQVTSVVPKQSGDIVPAEWEKVLGLRFLKNDLVPGKKLSCELNLFQLLGNLK
ncbi:MAG: hypothetical protein A2X86_06945 [Bdellovibrionales bacterium GWA2_49_15]|nr:MAG: hypothetical protein A2X86_06945 [Bdellovibrionales bacterium GWA2_49_15]HAZ11988.1 hypothetical protein [Bdellovibrionales bacterium]